MRQMYECLSCKNHILSISRCAQFVRGSERPWPLLYLMSGSRQQGICMCQSTSLKNSHSPRVSISPIQRRRERDCQGSEARHSCIRWLLIWGALTTCCFLLHAADNGREGHASYCSPPESPSGYQATCCSDCYAEQWAGSKSDVCRAPACRVSKRPVGRCRAMVRA